jgi:hypothetical protein
MKRGSVRNDFQLFLSLSKSFPTRNVVKLSAGCALTEVRVRLYKIRRDNIVLILAEVQVKDRSRARSAQTE